MNREDALPQPDTCPDPSLGFWICNYSHNGLALADALAEEATAVSERPSHHPGYLMCDGSIIIRYCCGRMGQ